jgi:hypothetical protein
LIKSLKPFLSRLSPLQKFFLSASPFLISILIHTIFILHASVVPWDFGRNNFQKMPTPIMLDVKKDENLAVHLKGPQEVKTDSLGSFKPDKRLPYLLPEVKVRPNTPELGAMPMPKILEQPASNLDIIGLEGAGGVGIGPSGGAKGLVLGLGKSAGSFSQKIQELREGGLDVVFVVDSTSSMSSVLREVKLKITNLASALRGLVPTCRIGLVTYRDRQDSYVTRTHPLTYRNLSLADFLTTVDAEAGGDEREAVEEGLREAVEGMKWNPKSKKFILLIGDAPPHKQNISKAIALMRKFREQMGGTLSAIDTRIPRKITKMLWEATILPSMYDPEMQSYFYMTDRQAVMEDFKTFAAITGGESARIIDEEKVVKHMLLLIFGTKWEIYLNDIMKTL